MKKQVLWLAGVVVAAVVLAACGGEGPTSSAGGSNKGSGSAQPTLQTATSAFGDILADPSGRTLYMFVPDKGGESTCYGECAKAWPALTVKDEPIAGTALDESLLGTTERRDGTTQVTYNGLPLYYFAFDKKAGDINGQGSGDVWWVVSPGGKAIRQPTTLEAAKSRLGTILTDADGRTLYMFVPDKGGESTCYGECAKAWPALTVKDEPIAGTALDESLLGTTERRDGTTQVTYNGLPLYYFAFDKKAGDINGQGSGDVWWVVSPGGKAIRG